MTRTSFVIVAAMVVSATLQSSAQQPVISAPSLSARGGAKIPSLLPGTKPGIIASIQGNALDSTNGALPDSQVRLRDARFGRIVDTQLTDKSGLFAFKVLDPGSYVVEIVSNNSSVLAASQLINVNAGEAVSAVVKLPFRIPPFASVLGYSAPQVVAVTSTAATSGILSSVITTQAEPVSP
jgi:hypothetical protein